MDDGALQHAWVVPFHVLVPEPLGLDAPRAPELGGDGALPERGVGLAEVGGGRIVVGADAQVMAADVLGEEVLVTDGGEEQPAEELQEA
ncbi:MAG: hypothetical protein QM820_12495 [Minicystis sp.]